MRPQVDVLFEDADFEETWRQLRAALPPRAAHAFVTAGRPRQRDALQRTRRPRLAHGTAPQATLPPPVEEAVLRQFPLARMLKGPGLHQTRAGVRQRLIDCSAGGEKGSGWSRKAEPSQDASFLNKVCSPPLGQPRTSAHLGSSRLISDPPSFQGRRAARRAARRARAPGARRLETAKSTREDSRGPERGVPQALVFCNTIESCRRLENALRRRDRAGRDFEVATFHAAISPEGRRTALERLSRAGTAEADSALPLVLV